VQRRNMLARRAKKEWRDTRALLQERKQAE
jgi:hypothetical protein